jgi:hypothetical protein
MVEKLLTEEYLHICQKLDDGGDFLSSIYINNNYNSADRYNVLEVIDDLEQGKSLSHYKKRFVSDRNQNSPYIDWKKDMLVQII